MKHQGGFSLVEISIAFIIIALLLAGALMPLSAQIEARNISDTRRSMDQIKDAIVGFAQANGRLPCPADGTLVAGAATAGTELYSGTACTTLLGVLPWSTLGVPETDAWGRRFTYRVSSVFSDAISQNTPSTTAPGSQPLCTPVPAPVLSSFGLCSLGEIAVLTRNVDPATNVHSTGALGTGLPAVFVSHGKNGYGAYQSNGVLVAGISANTDESANANGGVPTGLPGSGNNYTSYLFYSRPPTPTNSGCSETVTGNVLCEFDDLVAMIPSSTLITRMINAGRLP